jgi:hypothetical protein
LAGFVQKHMLSIGGEISKICQQCSGQNESYARFCMQCGVKIATFISLDCPSCGYADELNGPFCVSCGALTSVSKLRAPTRMGFTWGRRTKRGTIYHEIATTIDKGLFDSTLGPTWLHAAAAALGIIVGAALAMRLMHTHNFSRLMARFHWPSQGLVIYSEEPNASVKLESINANPQDQPRSFAGSLGQSGSISLPAVPPGNYLLTLANSNKKSLVEPVTIDKGHPTIVGFPYKLKLPADSNN